MPPSRDAYYVHVLKTIYFLVYLEYGKIFLENFPNFSRVFAVTREI